MSVLEKAIGWIAPPSCLGCGFEGRDLCTACETAEIIAYGQHCAFCGQISPACRTCPTCRASAPRHVWVVTDYQGLAAELIKGYKFGHQRSISPAMARLMAEVLERFCDELARMDYLIVPVPTATSRVRERSFDHAALLARHLSRQLDRPSAMVLARVDQHRQVGAKRAERLKQGLASYIARRPDKIAGRNILLIDDVITTGATLKAVTKVLRQAGAKRVDALVFAKSI